MVNDKKLENMTKKDGKKRQCNTQSNETPIESLSEIFCAFINCANITKSLIPINKKLVVPRGIEPLFPG